MPIVRKIMDLRTSKAICLPKSWLEHIEKEHDVEVKEVAIEVDRVLIITPILTKKEVRK